MKMQIGKRLRRIGYWTHRALFFKYSKHDYPWMKDKAVSSMPNTVLDLLMSACLLQAIYSIMVLQKFRKLFPPEISFPQANVVVEISSIFKSELLAKSIDLRCSVKCALKSLTQLAVGVGQALHSIQLTENIAAQFVDVKSLQRRKGPRHVLSRPHNSWETANHIYTGEVLYMRSGIHTNSKIRIMQIQSRRMSAVLPEGRHIVRLTPHCAPQSIPYEAAFHKTCRLPALNAYSSRKLVSIMANPWWTGADQVEVCEGNLYFEEVTFSGLMLTARSDFPSLSRDCSFSALYRHAVDHGQIQSSSLCSIKCFQLILSRFYATVSPCTTFHPHDGRGVESRDLYLVLKALHCLLQKKGSVKGPERGALCIYGLTWRIPQLYQASITMPFITLCSSASTVLAGWASLLGALAFFAFVLFATLTGLVFAFRALPAAFFVRAMKDSREAGFLEQEAG